MWRESLDLECNYNYNAKIVSFTFAIQGLSLQTCCSVQHVRCT